MTAREKATLGSALLAAAWLLAGHAPAADADAGAVAAAADADAGAVAGDALAAERCPRRVRADVVAFEEERVVNRYGSVFPQGAIFALAHDVVPIRPAEGIAPGNVALRPDKRPRPLVLRVAAGDCLEVRLQNLLAPERAIPEQAATRHVGFHVDGLQLVRGMEDDGTFVGANPSSLVAPGEERLFLLFAEHEGTFLMASTAALFGGHGDAGRVGSGLFGAVHVEPPGSEWYRSQVTRADLELATVGRSEDGHPVLDYRALYPPGHARAGRPILAMLDGDGRLVHSDLTAIVTGPGASLFVDDAPGRRDLPLVPDRRRPFREITLLYHENWGIVSAFSEAFATLGATIYSGSENMAINYGSEGLISRVLANRYGVGPARGCAECKFEEFFLSSWAAGDPALLVDVPARVRDADGELRVGPKATRVLYPDDPANVYHAYLDDPVRFRVLHAGTRMHHVHHQHAHPWLHSPDDPASRYVDSQSLTAGAAFTLEMAHGGGGGRAQTVGDSLFHCHIYFHFAMGMWGLWRVHDVFEAGTELDADGRPLPGARALPDGELERGVPIPAVVPLPTLAMPPLPAAVHLVAGGRRVEVLGEGNPGFPFFVPGVAGRRPPRPPLDMVDDGGLPRHVATGDGDGSDGSDGSDGGDLAEHAETRLDFGKSLRRWHARQLPEEGTAVERAAMAAHARRERPSTTPAGEPAPFLANGLPPRPGAPFADPCAPRPGEASADVPLRHYRAAAFEVDAVFNKKGWHYPRQRILSLWEDVAPTLDGARPPEPLFFRAQSGECVELWHTNLVPNVHALDDFVVRTPTDILGQHIHLVKFDVLASDGAANGWNYEDGTLSPEEVRERVAAINAAGGLRGLDGQPRTLTAQPHPFFGAGPDGAWLGAQTSVQRWYADPILDQDGDDRTLRTVFTHDHFGPTTHQQTGLFAGLLVEPAGSRWRDPETGETFGSRADGGPTRWRADVLGADGDDFREFALAFQVQQLGYRAGGATPDPARALRPPGRVRGTPICGVGLPAPCPQVVSDNHTGIGVVNYRNEPLAPRLAGADPASEAGDLAHVFRSIERADPDLNRQGDGPPLGAGVEPTDPFTPLLRAYEDDRVEIRVVSANDSEVGSFAMAGLAWPFEPADPRAGRRAAQTLSTGDTVDVSWTAPPTEAPAGVADYAYFASADTNGLAHGLWGLLRVYDGEAGLRDDLLPLPANPDGRAPEGAFGGCPPAAPVRRYEVVATSAAQSLPGGRLVYAEHPGRPPLVDPNALLYVLRADLDADGRLRPGVPVEPLVLRAAAGECIEVHLENAFDPELPVFGQRNLVEDMFEYVDEVFADTPLPTSRQVGLRPQLVAYDVTRDHGANLGRNPVQTAAPGESRTYRWYAGVIAKEGESWRAVPVEIGTANLFPADPLEQHPQGLVGVLVVEPEGAAWTTDALSRAAATVRLPDGSRFREMVLVPQNDLELMAAGEPLEKLSRAINYRAGVDFQRIGYDRQGFQGNDVDLSCWRSYRLPGGDPGTPVFTAPAGMAVRFRLVNPGGAISHLASFQVHGHVWQENPRSADGRRLAANPLSAWQGNLAGLGSQQHADVLIEHAGGAFGVPGDYLYRFHPSKSAEIGQWGIFRVSAGAAAAGDHPDAVVFTRLERDADGGLAAEGTVTADPDSGTFAAAVRLFAGDLDAAARTCAGRELGSAAVGADGRFEYRGTVAADVTAICAQSAHGGAVRWSLVPELVCRPPAASSP